MMKRLAIGVAMASTAMAAQPAQAMLSYVFNADEGLFAFETPGFVTHDTDIDASAMIYCVTGYVQYVCERAMFRATPTGDSLVLSIRHAVNGDVFQRRNVFPAGGFLKVGMVADPNTRANLYISGTPEAAAAVPEPATWAMLIGGFGMVGAAMRRRGAGLVRA